MRLELVCLAFVFSFIACGVQKSSGVDRTQEPSASVLIPSESESDSQGEKNSSLRTTRTRTKRPNGGITYCQLHRSDPRCKDPTSRGGPDLYCQKHPQDLRCKPRNMYMPQSHYCNLNPSDARCNVSDPNSFPDEDYCKLLPNHPLCR